MDFDFINEKGPLGRHTKARDVLRRKKGQNGPVISWVRLKQEGSHELLDLVRGLNACIEILVEGRNTKWKRKLELWAVRLISHCKSFPNLATRMRAAKEYFALCRFHAVTGKRRNRGPVPLPPMPPGCSRSEMRRILHQISRTSRSLREPDKATCDQSLRDHWDLTSESFVTDPDLVGRLRRFVRFRFGGAATGTTSGVAPSASFSKTLEAGGAPDEIKEITDAFRDREVSVFELSELARSLPSFITSEVERVYDKGYLRPRLLRGRGTGLLPKVTLSEVLFPYDKSSELSEEDWEAKREILFSLAASWEQVSSRMHDLPRARQVVIKERGWKTRVATPLEAPFRYLLGIVNSALLSKLEEVPQVVSALHGRPAEKLDWSMGRRTNLVFSADLKSATDYFPQDLLLAAADEISLNWPVELRDMFLRGVGPHLLSSPSGEEKVTSRGILMGSPVAWPMLSIVSAWLHSESGSDGWYSVCGDDYIGCHTYETYRRYLRIRERIGAVGSPGKDILGRESVGVFAEELISVGRCRWIPTVSVRAVLADPKSGKADWSQGPEVSAALEPLRWSSETEGRVCAQLHKRAYQKLRSAGVEPVGPRWTGSAGFPGVAPHSVLVRARRIVSQSQKQVVKWITQLEMAWSTSGGCSLLADAVTDDISRNEEFFTIPTTQLGKRGPLCDLVSSRMAQLSWPFLLAGSLRREKRVGLGGLGRRIRGICSEIEHAGRWINPRERIVNPDGIRARLQEMEPLATLIPFTGISVKVDFPATRPESPPRPVGRKRTGPGSPEWGVRKKAKLS